jgi:hypothetical protein
MCLPGGDGTLVKAEESAFGDPAYLTTSPTTTSPSSLERASIPHDPYSYQALCPFYFKGLAVATPPDISTKTKHDEFRRLESPGLL